MQSFFLASYTLRVFKKSDKEVPLTLSAFQTDQDLLNLLDAYLQARQSAPSHDSTARKLLQVERHSRSGRTISGIVKTGEYGHEGALYDVNRNNISYTRRTNEAEMLPFYFLAAIPNDADEGVVILQRTGQMGVRKAFLDDFAGDFRQSSPGFAVEINPLLPRDLLDRYLADGRVTKLRLTRFSVPRDIADAYAAGGHVEEGAYTELVIAAKRNHWIPVIDRVREVVRGQRNVHDLVELHEMDYSYDVAKVEIDVGSGRRRTIDLSNSHKLRAHVDVTDEVQIAADGHPEFSSIDNVAHALLDYLAGSLNVGV